jgi:hypothetical protein
VSYTDAVITLFLAIWFAVIAGAVVLVLRFAYESWQARRRRDRRGGYIR